MQLHTLFHISPPQLAQRIATAARARRVALGWSRVALAERAGVSADLIKRFETTGRITLERLLRLAVALQATDAFLALFALPEPQSIADVERAAAVRGRVYGKRRDAGRPRTPR